MDPEKPLVLCMSFEDMALFIVKFIAAASLPPVMKANSPGPQDPRISLLRLM